LKYLGGRRGQDLAPPESGPRPASLIEHGKRGESCTEALDSAVHRLRRGIALRLWDPLYWDLIKRSHCRAYLREFRTLQFQSETESAVRQRLALARVLKHASARIPFYQGLDLPSQEDIGVDPLAALRAFPRLGKDRVVADLDSLHVEMGLGTFTNASGGSTGTPVRILQDRVYLDNSLAAEALFLEWAGLPPRARLVSLWGAPRDLGGQRVSLRRRIGDWFANRLTLNAFEMQPAVLRDYLAQLHRFRPQGLMGYADGLDQLARYCQEQGLQPPSPVAVISAASTLTADMRARLQAVFECPVFDRYGTREVGAIAMECEQHEGLHVLTEVAHVEVVDDAGNEVQMGQEGELLITTLRNFTMPLIRYRVGDRALRGAGDCPCGRPYPRIAKLLGRNEACFKTAVGGRVLPEFFIHLIGKEHNYGDVRKFQFVQQSLTHVVLRLELMPGVQPRILADEGLITAKIKQAMGDSCRVVFERVESIPPTPTGKHLYTICRI